MGKFCLSRRQFVAECAACAACAALCPWSLVGEAERGPGFSPPTPPGGKPKIRVLFSHIPADTPTWPNIGYDYDSRKRELFARLQKALPGTDFQSVTLQSPEEAETFLGNDTGADGYVVYIIGIWTGVAAKVAASGIPAILVDDLYGGSGEYLIEYARAQRNGQRVTGVSSSRFEDVVDAVRSFECIKKLRSSTVLDVTDSEGFWGDPGVIEEVFGTAVHKIGSAEINRAYRDADRALGRGWAERWIRNAEAVIEPGREEIERSGLMYAALLDLLDEHDAQAVTIDCLSLFYGGKLPAYPCLGFFQLNNDGGVGACEGDLPSTMMMLMLTYLTGRPGYISDPVIDTSKNQIIYAHCVAPNRAFGPRGPANPYRIRSHSEDRRGAAVQSLLPEGEMTTSVEFNCERRDLVLHRAVTAGNVEEDKACRTKLAAEVVGDIRKLQTEWDRFGWHRVTVFGDHERAVRHLCSLLGIPVVLEA